MQAGNEGWLAVLADYTGWVSWLAVNSDWLEVYCRYTGWL